SEERLIVDKVSVVTGQGVEGYFEGVLYRIGNSHYVQEFAKGQLPEALGTQVYLVSEKGWIASFSLQDTLREESKGAIAALHAMGISTSVFSGDNTQVVNRVVDSLAIENGYGELLPNEKLDKLSELQAQGDIVAMVGDGVNDAPVLAKAQVSVAMGKGSQLAQASADMVLLSENLEHLPEAIVVARKMQIIIKQNFFWAIVYNLFAVPLAAAGLVAPWMAAIGMSASSLVVVLNSLRLKS
ncbi:MAG: HAD-IC family P-type ATPase, partial [Thiotrichaceae bacterium]